MRVNLHIDRSEKGKEDTKAHREKKWTRQAREGKPSRKIDKSEKKKRKKK